jgi:hypothetical protein
MENGISLDFKDWVLRWADVRDTLQDVRLFSGHVLALDRIDEVGASWLKNFVRVTFLDANSDIEENLQRCIFRLRVERVSFLGQVIEEL